MKAAFRKFVTDRLILTSSAVLVGLVFGCVLAVPRLGWCGADTPPGLKTKLTSLSLFKNGLGFVTREAEIPKGASSLLIDDLPAPAHGTFWIYSPDNPTGVKEIVAFEQDTLQRVDAISLAELIEANIGQTVDLRISDKETVRAKILSVPASRAPASSAARRDGAADPGYLYPSEPASLVMLQTTSGTVALNLNSIQQITSSDGPLKTVIERRKRSVALRLDATTLEPRSRLIVQYLAKGIAWAPSCIIDISDPQKARVSFKAEVINEIEEFENAEVNFITGYPNLQFADVTDPMAMRGNLAAFLNNLLNPPQPGLESGRRAVVLQQAVVANAPSDGEIYPVYANIPLEGQTREELFFYPRKAVSLAKGQRGYYPLFTIEVPYEHAYEWKIGDLMEEQERHRNRGQAEPERTEPVWHTIKLTNTGGVPWTTAPATTMQGGQILGQDLVHYTSAGSLTTVRVTQAVDVKADQAEYEVERKRNAANFYGSSYDLVEVRGKLEIANSKGKDVTLSVTKDLSGEVIRSTPEARVEQLATAGRKVNPHSVLRWELPVGARSRSIVEYSYRAYIRE